MEPRERSGELVVLGDWIQQYTYAVLEGGRIQLKKWEKGGSPEQVIGLEGAE